MKNSIHLLVKSCLIISFVFLTSCYSANGLIRKARKENQEIVSDQISGIWKNQDSIHQYSDLFQLLSLNIRKDVYKENFIDLTVFIEKQSDTSLLVSLREYDTTLDEFVLNGIYKKDCFVVDRRLKIIPFYPIFYIHRERKTIIGVNAQSQLVVVSGIVNEGAILIMGAGQSYKTVSVYNKE